MPMMSVLPRNNDSFNVKWIYETRKYISRFDTKEIYKMYFKDTETHVPTVEEWISANKVKENRDEILTAIIVTPDFFKEQIIEYLANENTRDLGLALSIEFKCFDDFILYASSKDLILYLENNKLSELELMRINNKKYIKDISLRIIDKDKIMLTILLDNFRHLILCSPLIDEQLFSEKYIISYIEHADLYQKDELLELIFNNYKRIHPKMDEMDSLSWDPFTKSRRYSHWLTVKNKMNEISRYYNKIDSDNQNIISNKEYIAGYRKFLRIYDDNYV